MSSSKSIPLQSDSVKFCLQFFDSFFIVFFFFFQFFYIVFFSLSWGFSRLSISFELLFFGESSIPFLFGVSYIFILRFIVLPRSHELSHFVSIENFLFLSLTIGVFEIERFHFFILSIMLNLHLLLENKLVWVMIWFKFTHLIEEVIASALFFKAIEENFIF